MKTALASLLVVLALSGCATVSYPPPETAPPSPQASPVVLQLMRDADQAYASSNHAAAALALERALRIEPRNALLWHRLAQVRVRQQRLHQAIQLASKSNTLTRDARLRAANWRLIAEAYARSGHPDKAETARKKAAQAGP